MATKEKDLFADVENVEEVAPPDDIQDGMIAEVEPHSKMKTIVNEASRKDAIDIVAEALKHPQTKEAKETGVMLNEMEKIKVLVPKDKMATEDDHLTVGINAFFTPLRKGEPIMVPDPIYNLLVDGGYNPTLVR